MNERVTTAPSAPNTPMRESPLSADGKQRLGPHPLPSPAPPHVPPRPAPGSHWRRRAGLARRAGRGRARGGALQPAEPPARAGWGRSGSDSPPRPTRPWRTSARTEPTVGAASGPRSPPLSWGALGEGYLRDHKHPRCSWGPSPASRPSIPLGAEPTPPCSRRVAPRPLSREPPHPIRLMGRDARRMLRPGRSGYLGGSDARRGRGGLATGAREKG